MWTLKNKNRFAAIATAVLLVISVSTFSQPVTKGTLGSKVVVFTLEGINVLDSSYPAGVVQVTVSYFGTYTLLGSSMQLKITCGNSTYTTDSVSLGSWRPSTQKIATFTVDTSRLSSNCQSEIVISWSDSWDDSLKMNTGYGGTTSLDTTLTACWGEQLQVSLNPQPTYLSSVNPVFLTVVNSGQSSVDNLVITIIPQGSLMLNTSIPTVLEVGRLDPGMKKSLPLQIIPQSNFPSLAVTLSYTDCMGNKKTSSLQIPFYATTGQSILVVPEPSVLSSGQTSNVNLKVINAGNVPIKNLNIILSLQKSPLSISPAMLSIGDLRPGEVKTIPISVSVPTTASSSETVSYQALYTVEGGGVVNTAGTFSFYIAQTSRVTITSTDIVPQSPQVGGNVIVAVGLINDGSFPVYGVNVSATASQGLAPLRSTYTYLGQLNPQVLTSLPFSFKATQEGVQEVKFIVTYRDAYGTAMKTERTVLINVSPATTSSSTQQASNFRDNSLLIALTLIIIVAVAFAAYRRKAKK
jgi:hypothetical protein